MIYLTNLRNMLLLMAAAAVPIAGHAQSQIVPESSGQITSSAVRAPQKISLNLKDATLAEALKEIAMKSGRKVTYSEKVAASVKPITLAVTDITVPEALAYILNGTKLRVETHGQQLVIVEGNSGVQDSVVAKGILTGTVRDSATGEAVEKATVTVAGTSLIATTNREGRYRLTGVPAGKQTVSVRLLGYRTESMGVELEGGRTRTINITLTATASILSGVVTTATGVQSRASVGSDITRLNVDSIMQVAPISSVTDLLETRVPGMTVIRSSGVPGSPSRVRLRGTTSIMGNNDPIIVVDGVRVYSDQSNPNNANGVNNAAIGVVESSTPSPLDQIDPNSIESIDVLKGPSASSMYGSDAANGVIVITTKKGRAGSTRWNAQLRQGIEYMPGKYPEIQTQWGRTQFNGESTECKVGGLDLASSCRLFDSTTSFQTLNHPGYTRFGRGSSSFGALTVSGGIGNGLTYSFTGSGSQETGLLKLPDDQRRMFAVLHKFEAPEWAKRPTAFSTWSGTGNIQTTLSPRLTLNVQGALTSQTQRKTNLTAEVGRGYYDTTDILGSFGAYYRKIDTDIMNLRAGANTRWNALSWLPIDARIGMSYRTQRGTQFIPRGYAIDVDSVGMFNMSNSVNMNHTAAANTRIVFLDQRLESIFGVDFSGVSSSNLNAGSRDIPIGNSFPGQLAANPASTMYGTQNSAGATTFGWFVEPRLMVSRRFFVTPGFRLDGGTGGRQATFSGFSGFPKLSLSWVASEDPRFPFRDFFDGLKLRAAYGRAGVQPPPGQRFRMAEISLQALDNPATLHEVSKNIAIGNTQLRPERSTEVEGGFDAELLQHRLNVSITYAKKVRTDAILPTRLAPSLGYTSQFYQNIGVVRSQSFEYTIDTRPINSSMLAVNISLNGSILSNKVTRINESAIGSRGLGVIQGYPIFAVWSLPILGFADADNDGTISGAEVILGDTQVYHGPREPTKLFAIAGGIELFNGKLRMNTGVSYSGGMTQVQQVRSLPGRDASLLEQAGYAAATRRIPGLLSSSYAYVQNINTIRINDASLTLILPQTIVRYARSRSASISLQAQNLGVFTSYRGKDPNVNGTPYGNNVTDTGELPQPRKFLLQLSLFN